MKLLTLNFLTCAVKACKPQPTAFPLNIKDAELELVETEFQPLFLSNILPRIEWPALKQIASQVGLSVPESFSRLASSNDAATAVSSGMDVEDEVANQADAGSLGQETDRFSDEDLRKLHRLVLETQIQSGKLVCGNCGHEYAIRDGIANFLLPPHLV